MTHGNGCLPHTVYTSMISMQMTASYNFDQCRPTRAMVKKAAKKDTSTPSCDHACLPWRP